MYLTKYPVVFIYIGFAINIISLVVFAFIYIPESTKFLMEKGK